MAYIVGILTEEDEETLTRRGWEIEPAPAELVPQPADLGQGETPDRYKMIWVDAAVFEIMSGSDWDVDEKPEGSNG